MGQSGCGAKRTVYLSLPSGITNEITSEISSEITWFSSKAQIEQAENCT